MWLSHFTAFSRSGSAQSYLSRISQRIIQIRLFSCSANWRIPLLSSFSISSNWMMWVLLGCQFYRADMSYSKIKHFFLKLIDDYLLASQVQNHNSEKVNVNIKLFVVPYFIKLLNSEHYPTYRGAWFSLLFHVFTGTL